MSLVDHRYVSISVHCGASLIEYVLSESILDHVLLRSVRDERHSPLDDSRTGRHVGHYDIGRLCWSLGSCNEILFFSNVLI